MSESVEQSKSTYILSLDLGEKLEAFKRIGVDAPGPHDRYISDIQDELTMQLQACLPNVQIEAVYMSDLSDQVIGTATKLITTLGRPTLVSTCSEIAVPGEGQKIEVNRLIRASGEMLGIGPRPGNMAVSQQIKSIGNISRKQGVVIVEDGIFTGSTVKHLIGKFNDQGVPVKGAVVGFNCIQNDTGWFENNGIDLITSKQYDRILDWVPDHDFLPFIPGSGKVIGCEYNGEHFPFYDYRGASYTVPYIRPFGPSQEWASIPPHNEQKLASTCIRLAFDLFRDIEKRNSSQDIKIGDLLVTRPKTSVPIKLRSSGFADLSATPTQYLREMM